MPSLSTIITSIRCLAQRNTFYNVCKRSLKYYGGPGAWAEGLFRTWRGGLVEGGWMGWGGVGGWVDGVRDEANKPPLCQLFACNYPLKHLKVRPQKTRPRKIYHFPALTYARAHPQTGVAPSSLPDTKAATQYHASSKKLPVTTDYHFLNPHHHQPHPFSIFVLTYFGRICEQFWLDLYVSKLGWKTSKFGGFEPPGVLVSPSPVPTAALQWTLHMYELEGNFTFFGALNSIVHIALC